MRLFLSSLKRTGLFIAFIFSAVPVFCQWTDSPGLESFSGRALVGSATNSPAGTISTFEALGHNWYTGQGGAHGAAAIFTFKPDSRIPSGSYIALSSTLNSNNIYYPIEVWNGSDYVFSVDGTGALFSGSSGSSAFRGQVEIGSAPVPSGYSLSVTGNTNLNGIVAIGDLATLTTPNAFHAKTNPAGYNLYVQGGILTEKVRISLIGTVNWADYVFEDNYRLRDLGEVENFIRRNKHLPGIPSAAEMKEKGLNVAEMDAKLLEKIEELTLYLIEQKKEIEILKKKNSQLDALLNK